MEDTIEYLRTSLRDQLAMSALPAVIELGDNADVAYAWADRMLKARKPPLPESG